MSLHSTRLTTSRYDENPTSDADELARRLRTDGYVVIPDFFSLDAIEQAREEMVKALDDDVAARKQHGIRAADWNDGVYPQSSLTHVMHTILFPGLTCPTLPRLVDEVLFHPMSSRLFEKAVGKHFRLRVELSRRSTGARDVGNDGDLPHAWHRDRPGEFTFGIFFDDLTEPDMSATAVLPGTHIQPFNPIWDFMLGRPVYRSKDAYLSQKKPYCLDYYVRNGRCNQAVFDYIKQNGRGILGKKGDFYIFFNDIWHGRQPNLSGRKLVMVRVGGFASEFEFPEDIRVPWPTTPEESAAHAAVPGRYRALYAPKPPANTDPTSILQYMKKTQAEPRNDVFRRANDEKLHAARMSNFLQTVMPFLRLKRFLAVPK